MARPDLNHVAGVTSTGSKRPGVIYGGSADGAPERMLRSEGCRVFDAEEREYLDWHMGLGAVALGYAHPAVTTAVQAAAARGVTGPLPPVEEEELADRLVTLLPWMEQVRFLKTGAEAVAAGVRLARVFTGRDRILGCGYHGWLDWCTQEGEGVPDAVRALYGTIPFNDPEVARETIRRLGGDLAAVVVEPAVDAPPSPEWFQVLRQETDAVGALLILDEIKTFGRVAPRGAVERWGGGMIPDLVVIGKALANGFPLAVVGGRRDVMETVHRTWISSTLATESVSLAAALATLEVMETEEVPAHLGRIGGLLYSGFLGLAGRHPDLILGARGIAEMCHLQWRSEDVTRRVTLGMVRRGILLKRSAYNFASLAHGTTEVERTLSGLDDVLAEITGRAH